METENNGEDASVLLAKYAAIWAKDGPAEVKINLKGLSDVNSIFAPQPKPIASSRTITKAESHYEADIDLDGIGSLRETIEMVSTRKMSLNPEMEGEFD